MKKKLTVVFLLLLNQAFSQKITDSTATEYSFLIQDSPGQLFTMRQVNQNYLTAYRLFAKGLYANTRHDATADIIQIVMQSFFFMPLTHEEGHRSILTALNIGSVSQPYFNKYGAAYVKGVRDITLKSLRDTDLPNYIRLHTAGLESDYMLTKRMEDLAVFEFEDFRNFKWEYWMRKAGILQYYLTGLFSYDIKIEEEANELQRDIVGYDTYGAARHLHRPKMDFYRYTSYKSLTVAEKKFVKRLGYRSLLNFLNPVLLGKGNFSVGKQTKMNFGLGYTMSPFGDFIDENLRIKHNSLNISLYARQFQNRTNWFHGCGMTLHNFRLHKNIFATISGHYWSQPEELGFNTSGSFSGGALDMELRYFMTTLPAYGIKAFSIDLGFIYKTKGFLPEEIYLGKHYGFRLGTSLRLR
jgi:hypothetical protein